ncbi:hypothetical protein HZS_814 [Henneguya salminicola]|nr:hypothetical protein HZS_814 [Henneguya salminicola]
MPSSLRACPKMCILTMHHESQNLLFKLIKVVVVVEVNKAKCRRSKYHIGRGVQGTWLFALLEETNQENMGIYYQKIDSSRHLIFEIGYNHHLCFR